MKKTFAVVEGGEMVDRHPRPQNQNTGPDSNMVISGIDLKYPIRLV
jgi:hypothetical protein